MARIGRDRPGAAYLLQGCVETASKLRTYMRVRTIMSIATGIAVWAFARAMGLDLAVEWGVIAFVLNYIPFIGSLLATLFPTIFAVLQFGTWQAAVFVFLALQGIQFLSGSTIEPRLTGARLAMSPFLVLVAVFLGGDAVGHPRRLHRRAGADRGADAVRASFPAAAGWRNCCRASATAALTVRRTRPGCRAAITATSAISAPTMPRP